jgi:3-hydroxyisobutyrate dehydrogenase
MNIGWVGLGRMGYPMAERVLGADHGLTVWNRTRSKAEPLAKKGAKLADKLEDLAAVDVLFTMVATGDDVREVCFGSTGVFTDGRNRTPQLLVDCSSIGIEDSERLREDLAARGAEYVVASVSGNGGCVRAGKLSSVASGPKVAFDRVKPIVEAFAPRGVFYVGEADRARICKIAHNVMLGVVIENLIEITLLAGKFGVSRQAFLEFMNNSVMGSIFTQYKTPALVNLDWTTTFTPELLLKDLDLGLDAAHEMDVPMPVTTAARETVQMHIGAASLQSDPKKYLSADFGALLETMGLLAGVKLKSENADVKSGLEVN